MLTKRNQNKIFTEKKDAEKSVMAEEPSVSEHARRRKLRVNWIRMVFVAVIFLAAAGLFLQNRHLSRQAKILEGQIKNSNSNKSPVTLKAEDSNKELVDAVGKLVVLPANEQPTIATIADLSKLQGQPFFANAQVGDKVLIYTQAKKAILYRPSENKIIELAPLNIGSGQSASSTASNSSANLPVARLISVEIRNGSGASGAAGAFKARLAGNAEFSVIKTGNAKTIYPKTLLYVKTNKYPDIATSLQKITSAEVVASLPASEADTTADVLLILGQQ